MRTRAHVWVFAIMLLLDATYTLVLSLPRALCLLQAHSNRLQAHPILAGLIDHCYVCGDGLAWE
jgi:ethanolamine transporter EutH